MIPHHLCLLLYFMIGYVQALILDQKKKLNNGTRLKMIIMPFY